jgi:hypothetical protein
MAIARIRHEERFAMAAFAPPFGVHPAHLSQPRRRRQSRRLSRYSVRRGKKINPNEEDLSYLKREAD